MEIVDYDKTKQWNILTIRGNPETHLPNGIIEGFILRFVGESGKETRICCTPEELRSLSEGFQNVLK